MKKLILLLLFIPLVSFGQNLNGYKYVYVSVNDAISDNGNILALGENLALEANKIFRKIGLIPLSKNDYNDFASKKNICELLTGVVSYESRGSGMGWVSSTSKTSATFELYNCLSELVYKKTSNASSEYSFERSLQQSISKSLFSLSKKKYTFNSKETPTKKQSIYTTGNDIKVDLKSESSIREYFDENGYEGIEGIWEASSSPSYKLVILKDDYKYNATILESLPPWFPGEKKAVFEAAAVSTIMTVKWTMGNKKDVIKSPAQIINNALIEFNLRESKTSLYKVYPKIGSQGKVKNKTGEWAGNGSGVIISKSGYIITNHHVIEDADDIEVEFILNDEVKKFNVEIIQVDKTNDLAILKIFDMNFDGVGELPYNFKTRSSDVGTKVYAFGYPMALSIMGKEIKVTDGMISSKTGFDGNITTYQITAPIQGGNSGGPLFDEKGNLIGINSSGIRKDIASNVAYSIKTSYVLNLIDILPKSIELPSNTKLESLPLTEQIKEISKYVVLIKVK